MKNISKTLLGVVFLFGLGSLIAWGAGLIFIDDSGNFGIGNTTPLHKLDVSGSLYSRLVTLTDASSLAANWDSGNVQTVTLNVSNTTFTFSNAEAGGEYKLILKQDSTGGRTISWPSSIKWEGATAPTLTTTGNSIDVINFVYDGTNYIGSYSLNHKSEPVIVFSDDFNRTDSTTIGNSWTEANDASGSCNVSITSNKLRIHGGQSSNTCRAYHDQVATGALKASVVFTPNTGSWDPNNYIYFLIKASGGANGNGYGLKADVISNAISIRDNDVSKATGTFAFTEGTSYNIELNYASNGHMEVYIWATSGSKPGTPTLSFANGGSSYTSSASGSNVQVTFASNNSGDESMDFDNLQIVE